MPGGALAVARGDEVVNIANRVMPHCSTVVATQDRAISELRGTGVAIVEGGAMSA